MEPQHTPGPWRAKRSSRASDGEFDYGILDAEGEIIAEAFGRVSETKRRPAAHNAALISAAPNLADAGYALGMLALQSERYHTDADFREATDCMLSALRVAGRF